MIPALTLAASLLAHSPQVPEGQRVVVLENESIAVFFTPRRDGPASREQEDARAIVNTARKKVTAVLERAGIRISDVEDDFLTVSRMGPRRNRPQSQVHATSKPSGSAKVVLFAPQKNPKVVPAPSTAEELVASILDYFAVGDGAPHH